MTSHVLVLNASFEPLHTVTWQRAVTLVLGGDAEIVRHDEQRSIRSARLTVAFPIVIRLVTYVRIKAARRMHVSRRGVLVRDQFQCAYCSRRADTVDHVIPRSREGGECTWLNMVAACRECNSRKGNRTPDEASMPLKIRPFEPRGAAVIMLRFGEPARDEWLEWL